MYGSMNHDQSMFGIARSVSNFYTIFNGNQILSFHFYFTPRKKNSDEINEEGCRTISTNYKDTACPWRILLKNECVNVMHVFSAHT